LFAEGDPLRHCARGRGGSDRGFPFELRPAEVQLLGKEIIVQAWSGFSEPEFPWIEVGAASLHAGGRLPVTAGLYNREGGNVPAGTVRVRVRLFGFALANLGRADVSAGVTVDSITATMQ
jgi:hypothetical protein